MAFRNKIAFNVTESPASGYVGLSEHINLTKIALNYVKKVEIFKN